MIPLRTLLVVLLLLAMVGTVSADTLILEPVYDCRPMRVNSGGESWTTLRNSTGTEVSQAATLPVYMRSDSTSNEFTHLSRVGLTFNTSFAGNKTVILTVTNKYGSDNETKTDYIEVVDCSITADFTANQTCVIGIPADIQFNSSCDNPGIYKNYWDFGNGDNNTVDQNPVYTYSNYGVFNVTHRCTIGINTTLEEIKTNYIIIGVNGTICADNCTGSGGGYVGGRDEYPNYLIVGATLGLLLSLIIIRRNEPE